MFAELHNQPPFPLLESKNLALQHADQGKDLCPGHLQLWDLKNRYDIKTVLFAKRLT
jgi:hypothetical protein